ncbi:MAG: ABC transporter substrate-binding protein, partial [Anaerolineae bacterium]|nr:ABC transporter substrate-binding protein [Anaerolineae bacterium]
PAQEEGQDYVVVADDWLSKLAEKYLGNLYAYPTIVHYTNQKNAQDASYAEITDPDLIEVGWKIYIPSAEEAAQFVAEAPAAAPEPVTLRVGDTTIWDAINPATGWESYYLRYWFYDGLIEWAELTSFEPGLAESWEVSEDGLVWTFKVREGVTFHDGTPCTAEDVAWSLNFLMEGMIGPLELYVTGFEEVVALDPTTVQITVSEPTALMLTARLHYAWILPRSVWEGMTYDEIMEFEDPAAVIGTGPYKLVEYVEDEYMIMEANEDYYRGKPVIDRIVIQQYATEDAVVQALLAGEIDLIADVPDTAVQPLQAAENVEVRVMQALSIEDLAINSHVDGTQPESLNDPAVRLAMEYAIDKQEIIDVAYAGYGEIATSILPPAFGDWVNADLAPIPFDPDEGNRILEEGGYVDSDGDGIREDADGNPLEYRLYAADLATEARVLEIISDGLAEIGISAPPTLMDGDSLYDLLEPDWDFDMILWGWGWDPDPDFAVYCFTCQSIEDYLSDCGYCKEEYDALYEEQGMTMDEEARRELIWEAQATLFEDRPYITLYYLPTMQAWRSDRFTFTDFSAGDLLRKWSLTMGYPQPVQ